MRMVRATAPRRKHAGGGIATCHRCATAAARIGCAALALGHLYGLQGRVRRVAASGGIGS